MITKWTSHLKDEVEKERFKSSILGSKKVLERLMDMVNEIEEEMNSVEVSPKNYEIPNWDYRQAHYNGFRQCLHQLRKILTIEEDQPK